MRNLCLSMSFLEQINSAIIVEIVQFLDPNEVTKLALSSRKTRLLLGQVIVQSLSIQKMIYQTKANKFETNQYKTIKEYYRLLKESQILSREPVYLQLLSSLNSKNMDFFQYFFSSVFGKDIKLNPSHFQLQKSGLQELHQEVIQNLKNMSQNSIIPSKKVQDCNFIGYLPSKLGKVVEFIKRFLKQVRQVQQIEDLRNINRDYVKDTKYLDMFKNIQNLSYKQQYLKPIFYLTSNKCYHNFIGFNLNSIILSFLQIQEIKILYNCDAIFSRQILKLIPILSNSKKKEFDILQNIPQNPKILEIYQQMLISKQMEINRNELCEIRAYQNPPTQVILLFNAVFAFYELSLVNRFHINLAKLTFSQHENFQFLIGNEIIQISDKQQDILDSYFQNVPDVNIVARVSRLCQKIYINLQINYKFKKYQLNYSELSTHIRYCNKINAILAYQNELDTFSSQIQQQL